MYLSSALWYTVRMEGVLILLTAVIFFFVGRYAGHEDRAVHSVKKNIKRMMGKTATPGVINYPNQDDIDYEESEQKKIDDDQVRAARDAGLPV